MTSILPEAFRHAAWATHALLVACAGLTRDQLDAPGAGYGGVLATLNHVVFADANYAAMLTGDRPDWLRDRVPADALDELSVRVEATLAAWERLLADGPDVDRDLRLDRGAYVCDASLVVVQALHHGAAHREQVRARLATFGVTPPDLQPWAFANATGRSQRVDATTSLADAVRIRDETPADTDAIRDLTAAAFADMPYSDGDEPALVDALRAADALSVSLVAEHDGAIVGHIAFSPAQDGDGTGGWYALGPVSVTPDLHRRGIGGALIRAGLARLVAGGARGCILVGHTDYYPRFGFVVSPDLAPPGQPATHFMVNRFRGLRPSAPIRFHRVFGGPA